MINPPVQVACDGTEWVSARPSYRKDNTGRVWCYNCDRKLYAYKGNIDIEIACPHPDKCKALKNEH